MKYVKAEKKKRKVRLNAKNIVVLIFLIALIVGFYLCTSDNAKEKKVEQDEYTVLSSKDLETGYPETPKEVVKLYCRMAKYLYDDSISAEETETIVQQMRKLFAEPLLDANTLESQLEKLEKDVKGYASEQKKIIGYEVDEKSLETQEVKGVEKASIVAGFSVKHKDEYEHTNEEFVLVKDTDGRWKIFGWQLAEDYVSSEETES